MLLRRVSTRFEVAAAFALLLGCDELFQNEQAHDESTQNKREQVGSMRDAAMTTRCPLDESRSRPLSDTEREWLRGAEECASHALGMPVHVEHPPRVLLEGGPHAFDLCFDGECLVVNADSPNATLKYSPTCRVIEAAQEGLLRPAFLDVIVCDMLGGCDRTYMNPVYAACSGYIDCGGGTWLVGFHHRCNGVAECANGSDEANCEYPCGDGTAIAIHKVCDGREDCSNAADEKDCLPED